MYALGRKYVVTWYDSSQKIYLITINTRAVELTTSDDVLRSLQLFLRCV